MSPILEEHATVRRRVPSPASLAQKKAAANGIAVPIAERTAKKTLMTTVDNIFVEHPSIRPIGFGKITHEDGPVKEEIDFSTPPSLGSQILYILLKPFQFLIFALIHIGLQLVVSAQTMKTLVQVFCLPHLFPVAPELVRILRKDIQLETMTKLPRHLAVILPAGNDSSESEEDEWAGQVAQLAQWAVACGIKCLSIMRTDRKWT